MTATAIREYMDQEVPEGGTARLRFEVVDAAGGGIPIASLLTLKLTLYDEAVGSAVAGPYINNRNAQSILNVNGGALTEVAGPPQVTTAVLTLSGADNPIVTAGKRTELHVAYLEWTWTGGGPGRIEKAWTVRDMARV